jgi:hypothetical protein
MHAVPESSLNDFASCFIGEHINQKLIDATEEGFSQTHNRYNDEARGGLWIVTDFGTGLISVPDHPAFTFPGQARGYAVSMQHGASRAIKIKSSKLLFTGKPHVTLRPSHKVITVNIVLMWGHSKVSHRIHACINENNG